MSTDTLEHNERDAGLDALLDEALAPPPAPPGLAERVVAQTGPPGEVHAAKRASDSPVLARIGEGPVGMAAAAVIALVMLTTWALLPQQSVREGGAQSGRMAELGRALDSVATVADGSEATLLDQRIEVLQLQVEMTGSDPLWLSAADPIDAAAVDVEAQQNLHEPIWLF